ncbi:RING finger protein nhl-1 [Larimichthys crocea]|uniref:RING finger protein nhl-1 n=1 Tax=Larimichthys crocea TaxID=215358 RepID=A0A6G0IIR2_LARCR|nr:RING finger protein nhl-1 [Larimichthys crocea]
MEGTEKTKLEEMLTCPVCQDIFKDPRQLPCGHSMCMSCLENMMDHTSDMPFRCPDCRGYFGHTIAVQKSYALANIAEDFRVNRRSRDEQKKHVYCDCCLEKKTLAMKMCLKCEVALCKEHVKDHLELPVFTGHPLVNPWTKQHTLATEASTVLRRQLTEYMDQQDIRRERHKGNLADSPVNSVTVVLLCLWFIVLYYAYNYSVENQTLAEALDKQQNRVHHIYSPLLNSWLIIHRRARNLQKQEIKYQPRILMLDLDTASPFLGVSTDLQTAERVKTKMGYPSSKSRFTEAPQVLSARCFSTGTHIWEVEAEGYWDIAVAYKSIQRKSKYNSTFGMNAQSWSLTHNGKGKLFAYHNGVKSVLSETLKSSRIAVMVNFEKGNITFSAVEPTISQLHEFKAELTQPLCLGLGLYRVDPPSTASIVKAL